MMEDKNYTNDQLAQIPVSEFEPLEKNTTVEREAITAPSLSFLQDSWRRLKKNKAAVISTIFLLIVLLISVVTIFASPHDPTEQNASYINLPPKIPGIDINGLNGVSEVGGQMVDRYEAADVPDDVHFYLGTDALGRDLLSRLFMGVRISLFIAFIAATLDIIFGVTYGVISGLLGGRVDNVMQRIIEVLSESEFSGNDFDVSCI
ncbi:hypothetical protein GCM10025854_20670 [Tetragenococcus muriaticus]|nr:hypothetical protein GCM10025854_20670 [Tetragenococcus muriaticus]